MSRIHNIQDLANGGTWHDSFNESTVNGLVVGLAEIPLAPNKAPTGIPALTGNFKVEQTITINSSSIEDADNFEGWTPTYEYSWEVTSDNGSSWTELTSADATDGDDSYTLTSEENGKQVRGVVSYLDGYGTNEKVQSDIALVTPILLGNSLYTIIDGPSWTEAEANAVKLGGHLVKINDASENNFLVNNYSESDSLQRPSVSVVDGVLGLD